MNDSKKDSLGMSEADRRKASRHIIPYIRHIVRMLDAERYSEDPSKEYLVKCYSLTIPGLFLSEQRHVIEKLPEEIFRGFRFRMCGCKAKCLDACVRVMLKYLKPLGEQFLSAAYCPLCMLYNEGSDGHCSYCPLKSSDSDFHACGNMRTYKNTVKALGFANYIRTYPFTSSHSTPAVREAFSDRIQFYTYFIPFLATLPAERFNCDASWTPILPDFEEYLQVDTFFVTNL